MDFRDAAVAESRKAVGENDPASTNLSLCLPVEPRGRMELAIACVVDLAVVLVGYGVAPIVVFFVFRTQSGESAGTDLWPPLLPVFVAFIVALNYNRVRWWLMKMKFARRPDNLLDPHAGDAFLVFIEDPATHDETKVFIEDKALCVLDEARGRIILEGYACRYVIRGQDVTALSRRAVYASSGVVVHYQVGKATLGLSISHPGMGLVSFLLLAFAGGLRARSLEERFRRTLGREEEKE